MAIGHQRQHGAGPVVVGVALILIFASAVTVAAAVAPGSAPSAAAPGAAGVHPCRPDQVTAAAGPSAPGASPAGVVVQLRDVTGRSCSLRGTPEVTISAPAGGVVPSHALPPSEGGAAVVLRPGSGGAPGTPAVVGITWSGWGCAGGSYSLGVRFAGWSHPVTALYDATVATSGARCAGAGTSAVLVGPVGPYGG